MKRIERFLSENFYKDMGLLRFLGIYVLGDALIIVPFILIVFPIIYLLFGPGWVLVLWCIYMIVRNFIEIIYWLFHQFREKKEFRPAFPFKSFDNNQVYIIYQLLNTIHCIIYIFILIYILT